MNLHERKTGLIVFLRKIALFETCFNIAWSVLIVGMALFFDCHRMNIYIPEMVGIIGIGVIAVSEVFVWFRFRKNKQEKSAVITYQIFNYFVPFVLSIIKIVFFDSIYTYEGGFFPGFDALGAYVYYIFIVVMSFLGFAIFNIVRLINKKRKIDDHPVITRIYDFLNVVLLVAVIILCVSFMIAFGVDWGRKKLHQREISKNEEYRAQVLSQLIESDIYKNAMWSGVNDDGTIKRNDDSANVALFDEAEYEICWEAYTYALYVEMLSKDEGLLSGDESVGISKVSKEVLLSGRDNYVEFTKRYTPINDVEMQNQDIVYDSESNTVSVSSKLYCSDVINNNSFDAFVVVVFDKDWKVIDIHCQDEALLRYEPY